MQRKLFWSLVGFSVTLSLFLCVLLAGGMYLYFSQQLRTRLADEADSISRQLSRQEDAVRALQNGIFTSRVTLIDADGTVLYDNQSDFRTMENHGNRPEVTAAMADGVGWSSRTSETLGQTSIYYARKLQNGQILRLSGTEKTIMSLVDGMIGWLVLAMIVCALLASQVARPLTRVLIRPLNRINLDEPLQSDGYEELSPMLRRMDAQNQRIKTQMEKLKRQQTELNTILDSLREGLVVLDDSHRILAINPAARRILGAGDGDQTGRLLSEVNRHETLMRLLRDPSGTGELIAAGRFYRVSASVASEDLGMVLLLQDVTEERSAEQNRQQFSANVSHELRTPLTTISGYAEMLETGLAKPEDTAALAAKIHQESLRMLSLIEDILRLSKLDEGAVGEKQPIDLLMLAKSCVSKLSESAALQEVAVTAEGESAVVLGDRTLLEEMVLNLLDNAIKYNKRRGQVLISVGMDGAKPRLTVADTGVGIPEEHQNRVFERFYRVDKSRSKETGGTGLGLSIVKHGAQLHGAEITLKSKPDQGTTITLLFPAQKEAQPSEAESLQP